MCVLDCDGKETGGGGYAADNGVVMCGRTGIKMESWTWGLLDEWIEWHVARVRATGLREYPSLVIS